MMKEFANATCGIGYFYKTQVCTYIKHPYLQQAKKIIVIPDNAGFRIKHTQTGDKDFSQVGDLLIPLVNADSLHEPCIEKRMRGLQIISGRLNQEGKYQKSFYKDIPITGCYCELIPYQCRGDNYFSENVKRLFIVEGVATGLSLLDLTDFESPVFCAMSCHNFINVAKAWRHKLDKDFSGLHKDIQIIIGADNDKSGLGAKKAQEVINSGYAVKKIMPPVTGMDWNDYYISTFKGV